MPTPTPTLEPLAEVAALPDPVVPDWIEQISPQGEADPLAQIRIRFKAPLIPLETLESPEQEVLLQQFQLAPELPGSFRFLTPRMVGFQGDRALPQATRFRVTLKAGLADLEGHQLDQDFAWTFNTDPIQLSDLPGLKVGADPKTDKRIDPIDLKPTLQFVANAPLDPASLREHVRLTPQGQDKTIPLEITPLEESDRSDAITSSQAFNPALKPQTYRIIPKRSLQKATRYYLEFTPGLRPAGGNLASEKSWERSLETYAPLAFEEVVYAGEPGYGGAYGRFTNGLGELRFNHGLVAESVLEAITVEPPPKQAPQLLQSYDGDRTIQLNPWALEPATDYRFSLGTGLTDEFGQTLEKPVTVNYRTGDLSADLWAPSGLNIFPANQELQLNVSTVNLPDSSYQATFVPVQPTDLIYTDGAYPRENRVNLLPEANQWQRQPAPGNKNEIIDQAIPLRERLGSDTGLLAYGVQATTGTVKGEPRQSSFYGLVQLTNLGVFAQWFPESGLIQVHKLSDGAPVKDAPVAVYRSELDRTTRGNPRACATGNTDENGILRLDQAALQPCMVGRSRFSEPPELLAIARDPQRDSDWAFVRTQAYSGSYGYGIYADWSDDEPQSRGVIFSDRQLYQPGETAWFTGVADYLKNGVLTQDQGVAYAVSIEDPEGNRIDLGRQTTNAFGSFSIDWTCPEDQTVGNYGIVAKSDAGVEIRGEFRVAEFKPPNFKVALSLDQAIAKPGQTVETTTQSNYLFGPPVQQSNIAYYVTRQPSEFTPNGWEQFSFGRRWNWPEEKPTLPNEVLQTRTQLDRGGSNLLRVTVAEDLPYPMTYRVDGEVTDISNLSVADSQSFTALPSDRLIGLQGNFVGEAGKDFPVQVIVTDPQGEAIANQRVTLDLQQATYSRVTQVIEGSRLPVDQVEYTTVSSSTVRSRKTAQTVKLTPPESGSYRLRANFANAQGEQTATDLSLWATGPTPVFWGGRYNNNRLTLQLDRETYAVGDTATALIQSPYADADLYFAVVRDRPLYESHTRISGGAPQIQFTVTPDMLPNAAVEAVLVRRGEALEQVDSEQLADLENLSSIGFAPFKTQLDDQYLQVQVQAQKAELQPSETETLNLSLKNHNNRPLRGQFTVMVVNEAVLQLSGYRPPDLVETVYAEQPIATRFADNRQDVALTPLASPLEKGWGYGGGFSSGAANTRLRQDFRPLAYFQGSVLSDAQGKAQVSFQLPDDLTTWRAMVVATDGQLHFGQADTTFVATQPLITNPLLPQFARQGDRFQAGVSVTNRTGKGGRLALTGQLQQGLEFADGGDRTDRITHSATVSDGTNNATNTYRFDLVANQPGEAQVEFRTQLGNAGDAWKLPLPIKPLEVTEQVVEAGTTLDSVTVPLNLGTSGNTNVVPETGGLEIVLASNLLGNLTLPIQATLEDNDWPCLDNVASRLAIASQLQQLSQRTNLSLSKLDLPATAQALLTQLSELQRDDGGFAPWPGLSQSDPFVTPYAVTVLARAQAAGFPVATTLLNPAQGYLNRLLGDPGQSDVCQEASCKNRLRLEILDALAELGDVRNQYVPALYEQRDDLDLTGQLQLARHLSRLDSWQREATDLAQQLQERMYTTGRSATVNLPQRWSWLNSQTVAQAQALRLYVTREGDPEFLARLVQGVLNQRRSGTWGSSYGNAQALMALVDYAQRSPNTPEFQVEVRLEGEAIANHRFQTDNAPPVNLTLPMAELPQGDAALQLNKSGSGELHYLTAYRYRPQGNPPGRLQGLRITRRIYPANQPEVLHQLGLTVPEQEITLPLAQVFDVGLEVIADHPVDHVIITDPLPAGLEAVDTSFQTSTQALQAQQDSWQIDYQRIYRDRIFAYAEHLDPGVYRLHYLVRSVTPGQFLWPGATAELQHAPEEFGRTTTAQLVLPEG